MRNNVSPLLALAPQMLQQSTEQTFVFLPAALGDKLPLNIMLDQRQFCSWYTRIEIARRLVVMNQQGAGEEMKFEDIWANLTATWCSPDTPTMEEVGMNRLQLRGIVKRFRIMEAEVTNMARWLFTHVESAQIFPNPATAQVEAYWAGFNRADPNYEYLAYARNWGHVIPWENLLVLNDDQLTQIRTMHEQSAGVPFHDEALHHVQAVNQAALDTVWPEFSDEVRFAILHVLAASRETETLSILAASMFGTVTALCKKDSISDAWFQKRLQSLTGSLAHLDLIGDYLSKASVVSFNQKYGSRLTDVKKLYNGIMPVYSAFDGMDPPVLRWIIEQSASHHLTHLAFVCEAIVNTSGRLNIYLAEASLRGQLQAWAKLLIGTFRSPWCNILGPVIPASLYPDLANLGFSVEQILSTGSVSRYAGKWVEGGTLSKGKVKTIAEAVVDLTDAADTAAIDVLAKLPFGLAGGYQVVDTDEYAFVYHADGALPALSIGEIAERLVQQHFQDVQDGAPGQPPQNVAPAPPLVGPVANHQVPVGQNPFLGENAQAVNVEEVNEEAIKAARAGWHSKFKNLPRNAVRIDKDGLRDYVHKTARNRCPILAAITTMATVGVQMVKQRELHPYSSDRSSRLKAPHRELTPELVYAFAVIMGQENLIQANAPLPAAITAMIPQYEEVVAADINPPEDVIAGQANGDLDNVQLALTKAPVAAHHIPVAPQAAPQAEG